MNYAVIMNSENEWAGISIDMRVFEQW